jgi:hypothetical protein
MSLRGAGHDRYFAFEIAHRLLLFRWRTERPAHYARLLSLRQFDNYRTTVPNRSSERGERGSDFPQAKLDLTPSCCIFDSISRLDDCIGLFCTLRMQTAKVPGVVKHFIPSRGYYEWKNEARGKQLCYFTRADGEPGQRNLDALQVSWCRSAFLPGVASEKGKAQTGGDFLRAGQREPATCSRLKSYSLEKRNSNLILA